MRSGKHRNHAGINNSEPSNAVDLEVLVNNAALLRVADLGRSSGVEQSSRVGSNELFQVTVRCHLGSRNNLNRAETLDRGRLGQLSGKLDAFSQKGNIERVPKELWVGQRSIKDVG